MSGATPDLPDPVAPHWRRNLAGVAHPIVFAVFPVVALLSSNVEMTHPREAVRSLLSLLLIALSLVSVLWLWMRDVIKAGLGATLVLVSCFALGQVRLSLFPAEGAQPGSAGEVGTFVVWILLVAVALGLLKRSARPLARWNSVLLVVALAALAQPVYRIAIHELQADDPFTLPSVAVLHPLRPKPSPASDRPDIYYIVVDGYGRWDVLEDLYRLDEEPFLDELERRGFQVVRNSRSNYGQTSLSFASSLNMTYLDDLPALSESGLAQREVARLIRFNEVSQVLRGLGYRVMAFSTGYRRAELAKAESFFVSQPAGLMPFEALLLESTAIWGLRDLGQAAGLALAYPGYNGYRSRITGNIDALLRTVSQPRPKFVFAHLLLPHPPFVFGPDGSPRSPHVPFRGADGDQFLGTEEAYRAGYRDQVVYTHAIVLEFLDQLALAGGNSSIVILQGDHGPGIGLDWSDDDATDKRERLSILNAVRAPGIEGEVWPGLTPVNTFRFLFNRLFGSAYPHLPDRSYYSSWRSPYQFLELPADPPALSGPDHGSSGPP